MFTSVNVHVCNAARYGLVRVRENAESIAFYGGEASEQRLLWQRLSAVIKNYAELLSTSRNLEFFTSSYRLGCAVLPEHDMHTKEDLQREAWHGMAVPQQKI